LTPAEQLQAVESRAFNARLTMGEVLRVAGVAHSTWSRAKARGYCRATTLRRVEEALDWYETKAAEAA
jgi:hypothetical protein